MDGGKLLRAAVYHSADKFKAVKAVEAIYGVSKLYNGYPTNGLDRTKAVYVISESTAEDCPMVVIGTD